MGGTFLILVLYAYARIYVVPAPGFTVDPIRGQISSVEPPLTSDDRPLWVGDQLIRINQVTWSNFTSDLRLELPGPVHPGDTLHLVVLRDGQTLAVDWVVPPISSITLLISYLEAAEPFAFWIIGTLVILVIRPRDARWRLLTLFSYLLGLITMFAVLSDLHIWGSALALRAIVWLALPIFLQLHSVFPRLPKYDLRYIFLGIYLLCTTFAISEVIQTMPRNAFLYGALLTMVSGLISLGIQFYLSPTYRIDLRIILISATLALVPAFSYIVNYLFGLPIPWWSSLIYLPLPVIPLVYFYAILRHQLGGLVMRSNRLATITVYFFILFYVAAPITVVATRLAHSTEEMALLSVFLVLIISSVSIYAYPYFEEWFELHVMGITFRPARLLEMYSSSISTSLDRNSLAALMVDKVLPSLLVRQSTILFFVPGGQFSFLYVKGLEPENGPFNPTFPLDKLKASIQKDPRHLRLELEPPLDWIKLALPLRIENTISGYWLLGQRDPDDIYSFEEIPTFQAIADQTAIALSNILQADHLRTLYAVDIERGELERLHLAAELHDEVLNQLAILVMKSDMLRESEEAAVAYDKAVKTIREAINGLRPAMLYYGLGPALETLIEEIDDRAAGEVALSLELENDGTRFSAKVELYLFRIVQQACVNALQHAHPQHIQIVGGLSGAWVDLRVVDDGIGFPTGETFDLPNMLANKHFGLAGMLERADLIGARLEIQSEPGRGSSVTVTWALGADELTGFDPVGYSTGQKTIITHPLA